MNDVYCSQCMVSMRGCIQCIHTECITSTLTWNSVTVLMGNICTFYFGLTLPMFLVFQDAR